MQEKSLITKELHRFQFSDAVNKNVSFSFTCDVIVSCIVQSLLYVIFPKNWSFDLFHEHCERTPNESTSYINPVFRVKLTQFLIFFVTFVLVSSRFWIYFLFIPFSSTNLISPFHAAHFFIYTITIFFAFYLNFFLFHFPIIFISSPYIISYRHLLLFPKNVY